MRVLIVVTDERFRTIVQTALERQGHRAIAAARGAEGEILALEGGLDAIVLDSALPDTGGVEICRRLRAAGDETPVMMLAARSAPADHVEWLDAGADDCVTSPWRVEEVLARLRALVRRTGTQRSAVYAAGAIEVDVRRGDARVEGSPVALSAREFALLEYLVRNAGITVARTTIEQHVWGAILDGASNVVEVAIGRLRRKLGAAGGAIETVRGLGYRVRA